MPFHPEDLATRLAVPVHRQTCRYLSLHNSLLERRQEGFRFCQGQPTLLARLADLLQDDRVRDRLFVTLVVTHHQWHFALHGSTPPPRSWARDVGILAEMLYCPQICMLS